MRWQEALGGFLAFSKPCNLRSSKLELWFIEGTGWIFTFLNRPILTSQYLALHLVYYTQWTKYWHQGLNRTLAEFHRLELPSFPSNYNTISIIILILWNNRHTDSEKSTASPISCLTVVSSSHLKEYSFSYPFLLVPYRLRTLSVGSFRPLYLLTVSNLYNLIYIYIIGLYSNCGISISN